MSSDRFEFVPPIIGCEILRVAEGDGEMLVIRIEIPPSPDNSTPVRLECTATLEQGKSFGEALLAASMGIARRD